MGELILGIIMGVVLITIGETALIIYIDSKAYNKGYLAGRDAQQAHDDVEYSMERSEFQLTEHKIEELQIRLDELRKDKKEEK